MMTIRENLTSCLRELLKNPDLFGKRLSQPGHTVSLFPVTDQPPARGLLRRVGRPIRRSAL